MSNKRILVVDDESEIVEIIRAGVAPAGYEVDGAANAEGALDLVRTIVYDAAIIDCVLMGTSGMLLHQQIRAIDRDLADRSLFMSGYEPRDVMAYLDGDASSFIPKPFDVAEVVRRLERVTGGVAAPLVG